MIIASSLLALVVMFMSTSLISSAFGAQRAQSRVMATEIASRTLQEVDNLGYDTVSEGIECASSACTALAYPDPNGNLQLASNGCWYFGSPADQLLVPTQYSPAIGTSDVPVVPNTTRSGSAFAPPEVDGITYSVTVYPVIDEPNFTAVTPAVDCADELNGSAPNVPVTVIVEVAWAGGAQHVSLESTLFSTPQPIVSAGSCPTPSVQAGAHDEQLMANQETNGVLSTSAAPGSTLSVMFLDEEPTPYTPTFCLTGSSGQTEEESATQLGVTETFYGTSSQPYYSGTITSVHPNWAPGSGPNAADPPKGGTTCTGSPCNLEEVFSFVLPSTTSVGYGVTSITVADWDHEGDLDFATWTVS